MSIEEVQKLYTELSALPVDATGAEKRRRGFDFEKLLNMLLTLDQLEPRAGYRPAGEQIDGSLYLEGRIYLLEAKWHADPLPASTLYQFKGKVDGKLVGTIGIFVSMSGYAEDAVDALILGKGLNVILFDKHDMDAAIVRGEGFKAVLKLKLRKAAEEGAIFFPAEAEVVKAKRSVATVDHIQYDRLTDLVLSASHTHATAADLLIVCEGDTDRAALAALAERILAEADSHRSIKIVTAMGKRTIPPVANALRRAFPSETKFLIVTDGDNDPVDTQAMLTSGLEFPDWIAAVPNPSIETWLGMPHRGPNGQRFRFAQMQQAAHSLNIETLRATNEQFSRFYDAVLGIK